MPIHDWSRVDAGVFHDFHQAWTIEICNALNAGGLPAEYFAMAEQVTGGPVPDVVTLQRRSSPVESPHPSGGIAVADAPPQARFIASAEINVYAAKANRVTIHHRLGRVVAVIEIVSPGNKSSRNAMRAFVAKAYELLSQGISLLVVDLFPPTPRDPQGIHKAIWDEIRDEPFELPLDKPLTVAAYTATEPQVAYVEPIAVGDLLPPLPIFLDSDTYIPAPLEATYQTAWVKRPAIVRELVERGGP
jgi:hypothetical protein